MRLRMELFVDDLDVSVRFYTELLGFRVDRQSDGYASVNRGQVVLGLGLLRALPADTGPGAAWNGVRLGAGVEIVLELDRADEVFALYERVSSARGGVAGLEPPRLQPWGLHDFRLFDPDGYYLRVTHAAGG